MDAPASTRPRVRPLHARRSRGCCRGRTRWGATSFAPRAAQWDRGGELSRSRTTTTCAAGLLGICIPKSTAAWAPTTATYMPGGRARPLLRRDRAVLEHARLLDAVDRRAGRRSRHERPRARRAQCARAMHYRRIVEDGAIYAQPFSEGGAAAAGRRRVRHHARARSRAACWSTARRSSPRSRARPTTTACCAPRAPRASSPTPQHALPGGAGRRAGVSRGRRLGSARHARHGLAHAAVQGRVRADDEHADAARRLLPGARRAGRTCSSRCRRPIWAWRRRPTTSPCVPARRGAGHAAGQAAHVSRPSRSRSPRCASSWSRPRRSGSRRSARRAPIRPRSRCCACMPRSTP